MTSIEPSARPEYSPGWNPRAMRNPQAGAERYDPNVEKLRHGKGRKEGVSAGDEAPSDGNYYAQKDGSWTQFTPASGASGSFTTVDSKTVTVVNGLITAIV